MFVLTKKELVQYTIPILVGIICTLVDSKLFESILLFIIYALRLIKERDESYINSEWPFIFSCIGYSTIAFNITTVLFPGGTIAVSFILTVLIVEYVHIQFYGKSLVLLNLEVFLSFVVFVFILALSLAVYIPFKNIKYYIFGIHPNRYIPYVPNVESIRFRRRKKRRKNITFIAG